MEKRIFAILLLAVMLLSLVACSSQKSISEADAKKKAEEKAKAEALAAENKAKEEALAAFYANVEKQTKLLEEIAKK